MPRRKSAVHSHYRRATEQGQRKIELVECVHCGHRTAGNNAARLLKHLQGGCWPASGPDDPVLQLDGPSDAPVATSSTDPSLEAAVSQHRPAPRSTHQAFSRSAASAIARTSDQRRTTLPFLLLNVTVKETQDPVVTRLLAVPRTFTFRNLQQALSVAFGYKTINGLFDITYPAWTPGKGRPPRRRQLCIFHDETQRSNWHAWDDMEAPDEQPDERFVDQVTLEALLQEIQSCKMIFHVGPWAHEVEVLGGLNLTAGLSSTRGRAVCLSGQGHAVLETSDPLMWQAFKDAYNSPTPSPTQKAYRMYYEKECAIGDPRGLSGAMQWKWDKDLINRDLKLLPIATTLPASIPGERLPYSIDESADENEDEDDQANDLRNVSNAATQRNPGGQNDDVMYDQNNRGISQQMQHNSYGLAVPATAW